MPSSAAYFVPHHRPSSHDGQRADPTMKPLLAAAQAAHAGHRRRRFAYKASGGVPRPVSSCRHRRRRLLRRRAASELARQLKAIAAPEHAERGLMLLSVRHTGVAAPPRAGTKPTHPVARASRSVCTTGFRRRPPYRVPYSASHRVAYDWFAMTPKLDRCAGRGAGAQAGWLLFTTPFDYAEAQGVQRPNGGQATSFGWDLLYQLRAAGFAQAHAHLYWSEELAYLGPFNFVFVARKS